MSLPSSLTPLFSTGSSAAAAGYQVSRSLRFNSADSAYLSRTPAVAGNRRTWTWAGWVKRSALGSGQNLFRGGAGTSNSTYVALYFANDALYFGGWSTNFITTTAVFRDCSAWYHIVLTVDTTLTSNRIKLYVNNVEQAITQSGGYPAQNDDLGVNLAQLHTIGGNDLASGYADHYLADIHFIDGQALTPSSFTEVSATTGQLIPKAYSGTYTGNSFWLKFSDNSAATAATLGKDSFLLGNNWTPNNLSVTAGAGNDSLVDTPTSFGTDTSVGGEVRGNYATLNPLTANSAVLSNGNLRVVNSTNATRNEGTLAVTSGKYYWEGTAVSNMQTSSIGGRIGFCRTSSKSDPEQIEFGIVWHANAGLLRHQSGTFTTVSTGTNYNDGDIVGVGLDADNNIAYFYKNGSLTYTYNFSSFISAGDYSLTPHAWGFFSSTWDYNFGQRAFAYQTPGTNRPAATFKALCDTNLPAPLVAKPNTVFDIALYTGTGSTQSISSLNFSPDFLWFKSRSSANDHVLFDAVRGRAAGMRSNATDAEYTSSAGNDLASFDSAGFTVGAPQNWSSPNGNGLSVVSWAWDAGTSTVSNPDGSIISQVRANVSAGFSVVGWTSNGTSGIETTGHGLGVSPDLIIVKNRDASSPWQVFHSSFSNTASDYLFLNTTDAKVTSGATIWTRSSTTFGYRQTSIFTNGQKGIAYCFAAVSGYSSFGSYTGNGSTDGPFIFTSFRPRWLLIKRYDSAGNWVLIDTARSKYNPAATEQIFPHLSDAEYSNSAESLDILSNGFKPRSATSGHHNYSGYQYLYIAFAENPFQYARAR